MSRLVSMNGSEKSSKQNREMAVQVRSTEALSRLSKVFWYDWVKSGGTEPTEYKVHLPVMLNNYSALEADLHIIALSGSSAPEYVTIQNTCAGAREMTGWYLISVDGPQTFHFPSSYMSGPGATVRIESYTGAVDSPSLWSNAGDKAVLYDSSHRTIDSACYGNACP